MQKKKSYGERVARRKSKAIPRLILVFSLTVIIVIASFVTYRFINKKNLNSDSVAAMYYYWNQYDYQKVYDISGNILDKDSLHNAARTFRGYSSFYLSVSQTDNSQSLLLLDEAINNLRVALQSAKPDVIPQLEYMIGKSYFYKDNFSSYYYYADLAVKYLTLAKEHGYKSDDMAEYLGLSYASLGMTQESIESFTEALLVRESDTLLLAIAEQYFNNAQENSAKQYLHRVVNTTNNDEILMRSHYLLGMIYIDEGFYDDAYNEFNAILQKNENFADAHYGLGVLYEKQGEMIKARSEWRKTLRIQQNHLEALKKMSD